jgi:hypothetical protein
VTRVAWDQTGERVYETGVDRGVLYLPNNVGAYTDGYAWNGLVSVTESPSGAESNKQYADNRVYLNLLSAEEFNATIEAFTYPDEFGQCDGTASPIPGVKFGQQSRKTFGLAYRTRVGNDLEGTDHGYKLHLIYGALAAPSEKGYTTINDSPEAITFSWEVSTTPVEVGTVNGVNYKPLASIEIDSTKVAADRLEDLEDLLYGTAGADPSLPTPAEVYAMFSGSVTEVTPVAPTFNAETGVITIPTVTGVEYQINGVAVTGTVTVTEPTVVTAEPLPTYKFPTVTDDDWVFTPTP